MLRYGDGSPFPLGEGFLDLLGDAVNACAVMLGAAATLDQQRAEADAARRELLEEQRRLAVLEQSVETATAPCRTSNAPPERTSERAAEQLRQAARLVLEQSRQRLAAVGTTKAAPPSWNRAAKRVHAAAAGLFERHTLPGMVWSWWWDATGATPRAEALAQGPRFHVAFDLDVVPLWRAPVRLDALVPDLVVQLPKRRWFGDPVVVAKALGRCTLVYAHRDPAGRVLELRDTGGTTGWRIAIPEHGQASSTLIDRKGRPLGGGLLGDDELAPLIRAIDHAMIVHLRTRRARTVSLDQTPITNIPDPTATARVLLDAIGPTVRTIRARNCVPGELGLKRDVSDGVREEVYLSRATLTARYAGLPLEYRGLFDAAGFGRGVDSVLSELPIESVTAPRPPAPHPPALRPPARPPPAPRPSRPSAAIAAPPPAPHPRSSAPRFARPSVPGRAVVPRPVNLATEASSSIAAITRDDTQPMLPAPNPLRPIPTGILPLAKRLPA